MKWRQVTNFKLLTYHPSMWFFNKRNKVFLEDFSLNFFHNLFSNQSEENIVSLFHECVDLNNPETYISDGELYSIYLEIYSLIVSINYPIDICLRLEDSLKDYILNVHNDSYLYMYTLSDYNSALSDQISTTYTKKEIIVLIDRRFKLFKVLTTKKKMLGGYYDEKVVARALNRIGARKKHIDLLLTALAKQLFENINYINYTVQEQESVVNLFKKFYNIINAEIKDFKLY